MQISTQRLLYGSQESDSTLSLCELRAPHVQQSIIGLSGRIAMLAIDSFQSQLLASDELIAAGEKTSKNLRSENERLCKANADQMEAGNLLEVCHAQVSGNNVSCILIYW